MRTNAMKMNVDGMYKCLRRFSWRPPWKPSSDTNFFPSSNDERNSLLAFIQDLGKEILRNELTDAEVKYLTEYISQLMYRFF